MVVQNGKCNRKQLLVVVVYKKGTWIFLTVHNMWVTLYLLGEKEKKKDLRLNTTSSQKIAILCKWLKGVLSQFPLFRKFPIISSKQIYSLSCIASYDPIIIRILNARILQIHSLNTIQQRNKIQQINKNRCLIKQDRNIKRSLNWKMNHMLEEYSLTP